MAITNIKEMVANAFLAKRLNRTQYLKAQLIALIPMVVFTITVFFYVGMLHVNFNDGGINEVIYWSIDLLVVLCLLMGSLCAGVARLHDCNHSGWWILLIIGISSLFHFYPLLLLFIWPGSKGNNKFGDVTCSSALGHSTQESGTAPMRF